jgi:hypothetical protein
VYPDEHPRPEHRTPAEETVPTMTGPESPSQAAPPMARPRVAAGHLIRNASVHVLMVKPTYKDGWDIPAVTSSPTRPPPRRAPGK